MLRPITFFSILLPFIMGKVRQLHEVKCATSKPKHSSCTDHGAPICPCDFRIADDDGDIEAVISKDKVYEDTHEETNRHSNSDHKNDKHPDDDDVKELVIIGAGPHSLTLVLRLLEPEADLMPEKERHSRAEFLQRMRPLHEVRRHVANLVLQSSSSKGNRHKRRSRLPLYGKTKSKRRVVPDGDPSSALPPIPLDHLLQSTLLVDDTVPVGEQYKGWLGRWKQNFDAIQIPVLRSPISAHCDPYDHRSLEFYAEKVKRADSDLVAMSHLPRGSDYKGPFQAPSTMLFHDFHNSLAKAYGIHDMVQQSTRVTDIVPVFSEDSAHDGNYEPFFEVYLQQSDAEHNKIIVKAKRVVCAMGPMFQTGQEAFWEPSLRNALGKQNKTQSNRIALSRILHCHEIVPWLLQQQKLAPVVTTTIQSLLIVGGGVTSVQLALLAASKKRAPWCQSVTLMTRSKIKVRQFDLENKWMGPQRGKLLEHFASLDPVARLHILKESRQGGSVPPDILGHLRHAAATEADTVQVQEEVEIANVIWDEDHQNFQVHLYDSSSSKSFDMIWMATGTDNDLEFYPALATLQNKLPVQVVGGLPVLGPDLTWKHGLENNGGETTRRSCDKTESLLRSRFFVMGALAAMELGPDALNLLGARHGAVRIAKTLRSDMNNYDGK